MSNIDESTAAPGRNAQLSWIGRKLSLSNLRLEETEIFPKNGREDVTENLTMLVRHVNRTFPFYLPRRLELK